MTPGLPLALRLFARFVPADLREPIAGDLAEEYLEMRDRRGAARATLWLWGQAVRLAWTFRWERATRGRGLPPIGEELRSTSYMWDALRQDVGFGFRMLRRQPGFTTVAIFALAIGSRLSRGTSEFYAGDMRVRIGKHSVCFPDLVVVNGEPTFADANADLLLNPTVVIEIFSTISKTTDRMQKLEGFLAIPKIKECLLVNENEMRIEHYASQNAKQWIYRIYNERDDVISLDSVNCKLSLAEVYAQVKLSESTLSSKAVN